MTLVLVAAACLCAVLVPYGIGYAVSMGVSSVVRAGARVAQVVGSEQVPTESPDLSAHNLGSVRSAPVIHLDQARLLRRRSPK